MGSNIHLAYGRRGEKYYGSIKCPQETFEFDDWDFERMVRRLANTVQEYVDVEVTMSRLEVRSSTYRVDAETVELLRTDPDAVIASMNHPRREVVVREREEPPRKLLRAGHDTLAEAFGDRLYCRVHEGRVECPGCGRWRGMFTGTGIECRHCWFTASGKLHGERWFSVSVDTLLNTGRTTYYLPRMWNGSGGWVEETDLREKYEAFKQEREACIQTHEGA